MAYTQTDPPWGSTEAGAESYICHFLVHCRRDGVCQVLEAGCGCGNYPQSPGWNDRTTVRRTTVCSLPADTARMEAGGAPTQTATERRAPTETAARSVHHGWA